MSVTPPSGGLRDTYALQPTHVCQLLAIPLPAALPIEFHDVAYAENGVSVLQGVTLRIEPGHPTVLIGPNGSGKTTLLRLAMGLLTATAGQIRWAARIAPPVMRQAFVFQHPTMLRRTVAENVRYALSAAGVPRSEHARRIAELLEMVGLEALATRPARRLSGGERQRLALARALGREPEILFLDEPTASLDPAATKFVEDLLRTVAARGIKLVLSTHDLGEARRLAGDVVMLHRGALVEWRQATEFFSAPRSPQAAAFLAGELLV